MAITPFVGTDNFSMTSFNNMINQANNSFASNKNLLDNWDFRNPINQRGITTATAGMFLIDRWKVYASGTATTSSGGIVLSNIIDFGTQVEISRIPLNVPITLSVLTNIGLKSVTHTFSGTLNETVSQAIDNGIVVNAIYNWNNSGTFLFCLQGHSVMVQAVKLELGSISTLANDPPMDYGMELLKCQRCFQTFATQSLRPTNALDFRPVMRITPALGTITVAGTTLYTASADL